METTRPKFFGGSLHSTFVEEATQDSKPLANKAMKIEKKPIPEALRIDIKSLPDKDLLEYRLMIAEHFEELKAVEHKIDLDIRRRLEERGARALPHAGFDKIELVEEWTPYLYDNDKLLKAKTLLQEAGQDEEANKLIKFIPEEVTIIPEHYEHGNPISITALLNKYGETPGLGEYLKGSMSRESLGTRLVIKKKSLKSVVV